MKVSNSVQSIEIPGFHFFYWLEFLELHIFGVKIQISEKKEFLTKSNFRTKIEILPQCDAVFYRQIVQCVSSNNTDFSGFSCLGTISPPGSSLPSVLELHLKVVEWRIFFQLMRP